MRLLVVEDNVKLADLIARTFCDEGYQVEVAHDGSEGGHLLATFPFELAIVDLNLPGTDGFAVIRGARRRGVQTPILILTARDSVEDRVRGLDDGADDYLVKPFALPELKARARALQRRGRGASPLLEHRGVSLDPSRRSVRRAGVEVKLTAREYELLEFFMRHPGEVLTRTQIGEHVWDMNYESTSNVIDVYVNYLRRKLDPVDEPSLIATVRGVGYRLE